MTADPIALSKAKEEAKTKSVPSLGVQGGGWRGAGLREGPAVFLKEEDEKGEYEDKWEIEMQDDDNERN